MAKANPADIDHVLFLLGLVESWFNEVWVKTPNEFAY
tara:strand:+ start:31 stop:141 length:111 start_codon:yes stop_codon:yes gene_type:complete